jgi:hypothetical protein
MRFDSLSEAIEYYSTPPASPLSGIAPYGSIAQELNAIPPNINNVKHNITGVMIYGQTVWGQSKIIGISKQPI